MKFIKINDMEASCDESKIRVSITKPDRAKPQFSVNISGLGDKDIKLTYSIEGGGKVIFMPTDRELNGATKRAIYTTVRNAFVVLGVRDLEFTNSISMASPSRSSKGRSIG